MIGMIKLRMMRWAAYVAQMGAEMNACGILVGNPEAKRQVRRRGGRQEDNSKMGV
jgi:hypothetical protein